MTQQPPVASGGAIADRSQEPIPEMIALTVYRGTSLIINSPPPKGFHRALGIVLL